MHQAFRTWFALTAGSCITLLHCEAIVSSEPPQYNCSGTSPLACPTGQYCKGSGCTACEQQDVCDHYDNDCNGKVDDGKLSDRDGDGFTECGNIGPNGNVIDVDCNDDNPDVHPGATEVCNGIDDDCDNVVDNADKVCPAGDICKPALQNPNPADNCIPTVNDCTTAPCTTPEVCDPMTGKCVGPTTQTLGAACDSDRECGLADSFCGSALYLGTAIPSGSGICTKECCTSSDCPTDFVCYTPGSGGRYCVGKSVAQIAATGTLLAGATTPNDASCRSGQSLNGRCIDSCCHTDPDCTANSVCKYTSFFGKTALACTKATGSSSEGTECSFNPDACKEGICGTYGSYDLCTNPCCTSATCGSDSVGDYVCRVWGTATQGALSACEATSNLRGASPSGADCNVDGDCIGLSCVSGNATHAHKFCSDYCCSDSDCQNATHCRPTPGGGSTYALRCIF